MANIDPEAPPRSLGDEDGHDRRLGLAGQAEGPAREPDPAVGDRRLDDPPAVEVGRDDQCLTGLERSEEVAWPAGV